MSVEFALQQISPEFVKALQDFGDIAFVKIIMIESVKSIQIGSQVFNTVEKMITTLNKPSFLIHEIQIEKVGNWNLFKFSESLQLRMETLLEKKKSDLITTDEIAELDAIGELDRIFTHINSMLAAQNANQ